MNSAKIFKPIPPIQSVYFGCHEQTGHYFWWPQMRPADREIHQHFENPFVIDGAFLPKKDTSQGACALHHFQDYTILSFNDYTVDHRPKSHSTFVLHHSIFDKSKLPLTLQECLIRARALFMEVMIARHRHTKFILAEEHFHYPAPSVIVDPD